MRKHGYTANCPGCRAINRGETGSQNHTEECRKRIEAAIAAEGGIKAKRMAEGNERYEQHKAKRVRESNQQQPGQNGQDGPEHQQEPPDVEMDVTRQQRGSAPLNRGEQANKQQQGSDPRGEQVHQQQQGSGASSSGLDRSQEARALKRGANEQAAAQAEAAQDEEEGDHQPRKYQRQSEEDEDTEMGQIDALTIWHAVNHDLECKFNKDISAINPIAVMSANSGTTYQASRFTNKWSEKCVSRKWLS